MVGITDRSVELRQVIFLFGNVSGKSLNPRLDLG
jgi:hypothetical protein